MSIYQDLILDHYHNPRNYGEIKNAVSQVSLNNPLCGDNITLYAIFAGDRLADIKFVSEGCAISKASASMLTEKIKGFSKNKLINLKSDFIIRLLGISLSPNRLKCALLVYEALKKLLWIKNY